MIVSRTQVCKQTIVISSCNKKRIHFKVLQYLRNRETIFVIICYVIISNEFTSLFDCLKFE